MERIDRRRLLAGAPLLAAAVLAPGGANSDEGRTDVDGADPERRLAALAREGLARRWAGAPPPVYRARLESELTIIAERRASRRFLAAAGVVRFADQRGIARSPGRGAAPSSLVAYAIGITGIDPVAHGLIFARLLHARLPEVPYLCLDVCAERRATVIDFAASRLGSGAPATGGGAAVFRSLGVEIDGLPALTSLHAALDRINRAGERPPVDLARLPLDDPRALDVLAAGKALTPHGLDAGPLLAAIRPDGFEDVVAAIALSRPAPRRAGMADRYVQVAQRRAAVEPLHPLLAGTRGLVIYQEQIIQIAIAAAGYSAADADVLRRALARQHQEVIVRERPRFIARAVEAGTPWTAAAQLFSHLERAAPSTFNRSHAVALALMVSWAAYLEAHHPGALVPRLSSRA